MATRTSAYDSVAKIGLSVLALTANICLAQGASGGGAGKSGAPGNQEQKLDISDLENKYWAPKDTDFSVVQNRTYSKENRYFLTPQWGRPINDQWSSGTILGVTANYFWSERFGVQAHYLKATLRNNSATDVLANSYSSGVAPNHNRFDSSYGVGFNIVPFYAKMSFWGKKIIYFDMVITPTIGMTGYEQLIQTGNATKSAFSYGVDITQYFFFTNYFAVRADLKNMWTAENIAAYHGNAQLGTVTGQKIDTQTLQDTMFLLGFTFFW